jgi:hypothetical protein
MFRLFGLNPRFDGHSAVRVLRGTSRCVLTFRLLGMHRVCALSPILPRPQVSEGVADLLGLQHRVQRRFGAGLGHPPSQGVGQKGV